MASIAVDTTADTSAATSAVRSPLALVPPPIPPLRNLYNRNTDTEKYFSGDSFFNNSTLSVIMASKPETSTAASSQPNNSSTPSPPPPPADFQNVASPLPPDLPPPPDFYRSSSLSPPPPPPPPSYLFPELSSDLPLPPPPQLLMNLDPQPCPLYVCSYDPPSPEVKSEYDPKLPPGFSTQNPLSPLPPPVPPPPRPTPPPPPTPPVRQASRENINIPPSHSGAADDDNVSASSPSFTKASSELYLASAEETQTKDSVDGASCNYPSENITDSHLTTESSIDGRPVSSELSSSTLTATLLLTPESGLSPLPPHALRVSPVPTDANTITSSHTDDLTTTSVSSDTTSTPNIYDSRDTTFDIDTPEVTPQLSEILGTHSPTPNEVKMNSVMDEILAEIGSGSEVTPHLSEVSGSHSATPTEEKINSVDVEILDNVGVSKSPNENSSLAKMTESTTVSPPDSPESERIEEAIGNESLSESTDYSLTEKVTASSLNANSNTEVAQMSSPFSTEPPSLFSLPTDSDTISADMDSLAADMLSPMGDLESYPADVDTSTVNSIATTEAADMFLTSSSGYSDTAYATADSNMESATMSPVFTESCTITPIPADFVTPLSTNPTTTPVPSPVPSSPLPYFDAVSPDITHYAQSHTSHVSSSIPSVASRMLVSASEHRSDFHTKTTSTLKRLVSSQISEHSFGHDDKNITQQINTELNEAVSDDKFKQTLQSSIDVVKLEEKLHTEEKKQQIQKLENVDIDSPDTQSALQGNTGKEKTKQCDDVDTKLIEKDFDSKILVCNENEMKEPLMNGSSFSAERSTLSKDSVLGEQTFKEDKENEIDKKLESVLDKSEHVDKSDKIKQKSDVSEKFLKTEGSSKLVAGEVETADHEISANKIPKVLDEANKILQDSITIISAKTSSEATPTDSQTLKSVISCDDKDQIEKNLGTSQYENPKEVHNNEEQLNVHSTINEGDKCEKAETVSSSFLQDSKGEKVEIVDSSSSQIDNHAKVETLDESPSHAFVFDFSFDDPQSSDDIAQKCPSVSTSLEKFKSLPSPVPNSPPKPSLPSRYSGFGGSMSPKVPLSHTKTPTSITKEADSPATSKSSSFIPLSQSPEEALELLDTLVGNMESLSADLPHSPLVKEISEKTVSDVSIENKKIEDNICEYKSELHSDSSSYEQGIPKDAEVGSSRNEEGISEHSVALSEETEGVMTDSLLSYDSLTSPISQIENVLDTSTHLLPSLSDLNEDLQCVDKKDTNASLQHSVTHIESSNNDVAANVLNSSEHSVHELIPSNDSQALHATNIKLKENLLEDSKLMSIEPSEDSKVTDINDSNVEFSVPSQVKDITTEDNNVEDSKLNTSETSTGLKEKETEHTHSNNNNLDGLKDTCNIEKVKIVSDNDSPTSFSSPSLHSIVEDVVLPPPASRAKTPPLPPPRSCINTPKPGMGAPLPPPRQYMLIPMSCSQVSSRRHSPPPAPPRSTSVRRSPPPPPPRSAVQTPSAKNEWIDFPPLPPPPISAINTPSTPPKLTPVPEESSFPSTPLPPKEYDSESSPARSTTPYRKSPYKDEGLEKKDDSVNHLESSPHPGLPSCDKDLQNLQPVSDSKLPQSNGSCNSPPALPPSPEEDKEEEPPPPPPPPVDYGEENLIPLTFPPPLDSGISPPIPPTRSRISTPPLPPPPKTVLSYEELDKKDCLSLDNHTNNSSILPASDMASKDSSATTTPENDEQGVLVTPAPTLPLSAPVAPPPPPPPKPSSHSSSSSLSSQLPSHSSSSAPPPPRCPVPQSPKPVPNSALWSVSPYGKVVINRNDLPLPPPEEEVRKTFHNVKNWGLLDYSTDTLAVYTQLRPNIQMGPQCGLVALCMASQVFPETKDVAMLLKEAREKKFTSHGEMFSSENMAKLANGINGMEAAVRRDVLCDPKILLDLLIHGNLILVPYDADQNHMPTLRNGHKAHWGIICGCLVQCPSLNMNLGGASKLDTRVDNLFHMRPRSRRGFGQSRDGSVTPSTPLVPGSPQLGHRILKTPECTGISSHDGMKTPDISLKEGSIGRAFESDNWSVCSSRVNTPMLPEILHDDIKMVVLWRQGKSRSLIASPLEKLCESNDQLFEYPAPSSEIENEFIIGSVQDGLAGQVVVLHKTKTALSDLVGILQDKQDSK